VNLAFAGAGMISLVHAMAAEATESPILAIASRTEARAAILHALRRNRRVLAA
jgi:hypothetical protein